MSKALGALIAAVVVIAVIVGLVHNNNTNKSNASQAAKPAKQLKVVITGAGSTFAAPLYGQLGSEYKSRTSTTINYQAVGSGAGVAQFIANTVNYGATDVALKDSEIA
jgi:phosphate transport system substrate-binding protein